jgi:hypothetical protein
VATFQEEDEWRYYNKDRLTAKEINSWLLKI